MINKAQGTRGKEQGSRTEIRKYGNKGIGYNDRIFWGIIKMMNRSSRRDRIILAPVFRPGKRKTPQISASCRDAMRKGNESKRQEDKMKKENRGETKSLQVTVGKLFSLLLSREGGEGDEFLNSPLPPLFTREGKKDK